MKALHQKKNILSNMCGFLSFLNRKINVDHETSCNLVVFTLVISTTISDKQKIAQI